MSRHVLLVTVALGPASEAQHETFAATMRAHGFERARCVPTTWLAPMRSPAPDDELAAHARKVVRVAAQAAGIVEYAALCLPSAARPTQFDWRTKTRDG